MGSKMHEPFFRQAVQRALLECEQKLGQLGFPQSHEDHLEARNKVFDIAHQIVDAFNYFRLFHDHDAVTDEFWESFLAQAKQFDGGDSA